MIESIGKLREFVDDQFVISGQAYLQGMAIAGSIEREIAERYMLLPVDAEGVPIHIGDMVNGWGTLQMHGCGNQPVHGMYCAACFIGNDYEWRIDNDYGFEVEPKDLHHVEPRTLEDVLIEYRLHAYNIYADDEINGEERVEEFKELDSKYVAELRELMGGDE